eukprot:3255947-Karenia_brevis.AAC.1
MGRTVVSVQHLPALLDDAVAKLMTRQFFKGHHSAWGEKLLAAVIWRLPIYGKHGRHRLPRAAQALKGWRRRCPARSRRPVPWATVAAISCDM